MPLFNHFDGALVCLQSVLKHTDDNVQILIVDDNSSEGSFESRIIKSGIEVDGRRVGILRNSENLGFTKTINRGMTHVAPHDVVILNSDTVVTEGWLENLTQAAYSKPNIATVTPFTNNGTICSLPVFLKDNALPRNISIDDFAKVVGACSGQLYPELPTCVGFCTYIRRTALEVVGRFDENAFPRGYGEENDFSCRARKAGFIDVLADDTFVYHAGGESFGLEREKLMMKGEQVLRARHPHYYPSVGRFIRENPLQSIHKKIHLELLDRAEQENKPRVLHILHNGPYTPRRDPVGGTERHVQGIVEALEDFSHWSLVKDKNHYILESFSAGFPVHFSCLDDDSEILKKIIAPNFFQLVHVHHTRWFDTKRLLEALQDRLPYMVSLHDFVAVCPRFHLFTVQGEHCTGSECRTACGYSERVIEDYREQGLSLLLNSKKNIAFSIDTIDYLKRILGTLPPIEVMRHGVTKVDPIQTNASHTEPLSIVTIAPTGRHKGREIFEELFRTTNLPSGRAVRWNVLGDWDQVGGERCLGTFSRENMSIKLGKASPHLGVLLSLCPETYSLACDELLSAGIPLVVGPLGAPAERIREWGAGWVIEELSVDAVLRVLDELVANPSSLTEAQNRAKECPIIPFSTEAAYLKESYREIAAPPSESPLPLTSFLRCFTYGDLQQPLRTRTLAAFLRRIVFILDALRLRATIQRAMESLLGEKRMRYLKNLR